MGRARVVGVRMPSMLLISVTKLELGQLLTRAKTAFTFNALNFHCKDSTILCCRVE
jgi:hypothetical protein